MSSRTNANAFLAAYDALSALLAVMETPRTRRASGPWEAAHRAIRELGEQAHALRPGAVAELALPPPAAPTTCLHSSWRGINMRFARCTNCGAELDRSDGSITLRAPI